MSAAFFDDSNCSCLFCADCLLRCCLSTSDFSRINNIASIRRFISSACAFAASLSACTLSACLEIPSLNASILIAVGCSIVVEAAGGGVDFGGAGAAVSVGAVVCLVSALVVWPSGCAQVWPTGAVSV